MNESECLYNKLSLDQQALIASWMRDDTLETVNSNQQLPIVHLGIYAKYFKRIIDIVISCPALIVSLPINAIIAIATLCDVGRPIFFIQKRIGKDNKPFNLIKFRNMTNDCDAEGNLLPPEFRVTKWGKFVRKTSLDELLNFWSILKGDMSLIGPRPMPLPYESRFSDYHNLRHMVRPGLDCPSHEGLGFMDWQQRFDNDVWYVENISFKTDLTLCLLLVKRVFNKEDNSKRAIGGEEGSFIGYDLNGRVIAGKQIPKQYYVRLFGDE